MTLSKFFKSASPLEGEVGAKRRVGGYLSAFSQASGMRRQYPPPGGQSAADLPHKGGGALRVLGFGL
ncbi:MAG TPA: hypothetical protein VH722_04560, partial [Alphaproteobacteria bacterium]|nr:hypothetical protein [Alphaproteobacteria bacterium]